MTVKDIINCIAVLGGVIAFCFPVFWLGGWIEGRRIKKEVKNEQQRKGN